MRHQSTSARLALGVRINSDVGRFCDERCMYQSNYTIDEHIAANRNANGACVVKISHGEVWLFSLVHAADRRALRAYQSCRAQYKVYVCFSNGLSKKQPPSTMMKSVVCERCTAFWTLLLLNMPSLSMYSSILMSNLREWIYRKCKRNVFRQRRQDHEEPITFSWFTNGAVVSFFIFILFDMAGAELYLLDGPALCTRWRWLSSV